MSFCRRSLIRVDPAGFLGQYCCRTIRVIRLTFFRITRFILVKVNSLRIIRVIRFYEFLGYWSYDCLLLGDGLAYDC